ncbi:MAG TPA: YaeQ family protein [Stenotrophomonas sp.]|nr:YaeQ family protein [Stenotrophomonas sp.]
MALTATVRKADLQISDIDRGYYANHNLTLAQHPSETDERLMLRLLAFVLFADDRLAFGRGLSSEDEPDLWRRDYGGEIEQWIELGTPEEARLRKAIGRAREVVVLAYGGQAVETWWKKNGAALSRYRQLRVIEIDPATAAALAALIGRGMRLDVLVQDGEVQLMGESGSVTVVPIERTATA